MDRNLRRMVWCKTVRLPLRFYETNRAALYSVELTPTLAMTTLAAR